MSFCCACPFQYFLFMTLANLSFAGFLARIYVPNAHIQLGAATQTALTSTRIAVFRWRLLDFVSANAVTIGTHCVTRFFLLLMSQLLLEVILLCLKRMFSLAATVFNQMQCQPFQTKGNCGFTTMCCPVNRVKIH